MEKKLSSYQKMKQFFQAQVTQLTRDIVVLIREPDSINGIMTKERWIIRLDLEEAFLSGSRPLQEFSINFIQNSLIENRIISRMDKIIGDAAKESLQSEDISNVYMDTTHDPAFKDLNDLLDNSISISESLNNANQKSQP